MNVGVPASSVLRRIAPTLSLKKEDRLSAAIVLSVSQLYYYHAKQSRLDKADVEPTGKKRNIFID